MKKILFTLIASAAISLTSLAQSPEAFKYQAVVRDAGNLVLTNQAVGMQLTIQQGSIGGTAVYTETFATTTNQYGLVNIEIGTGTSTDDFSTIDWSAGPYFIETAVDISGGTSYTVMGTSQLVSVPYALYAKTAESVTNDLVDDADADPTNEMNTGVVLNGTDLETTDGAGTIVTDLSSLVNDLDSDTTNELNTGVVLNGTDLEISDAGGTIVTDLSSLSGGSGNWTLNGTDISNANTGNVGIGTTTPQRQLSIMDATDATMVIGGNAFNNVSSGSLTFAENANDVSGDCGFKYQHDGAGNHLSLYSGCYIPSSGDTIFRAHRQGHMDIKRLGVGNIDMIPTNPLSVQGNADFTGVVTINGDLNITGNISKGSGTFKIDHPLDPENKYLVHSFVESPEMMNMFSGNITTDENGIAYVQMPDYFEAANKDFRYQLTVIGTFAQAIIKEKISENVFVIQTNEPNVEVSWSVTSVRADRYAEEYPIVPEVEKDLKGSYLHPELYGEGKEKSEAAAAEAAELKLQEELLQGVQSADRQ